MKSNYILVTDSVNKRTYYRRVPEVFVKKMGIHRNTVTCRDCGRYPCFKGIDGMASNLAITCHDFELSRKPFNP